MLNDKSYKKILSLILVGVFFHWALEHVGDLSNTFKFIIKTLLPFIFGASFAFVLNIPVEKMEQIFLKKTKMKLKVARGWALLITILLLIVIIILLMIIIIPELVNTFDSLIKQVPGSVSFFQEKITELAANNENLAEIIETLDINYQSIFESLQSSLESILKGISASLLSFFGGIVNTVISVVLGVTFSIYVVLAKDSLSLQSKQILYAFLPVNAADEILRIGKLAYESFSNFLTGQGIEAAILGSIFFVCMTLFKMPYAMLISVIIMVSAIIPIFGAIFASLVGVFLIVLVDPWMAFWFYVMFTIIQQLENNLIYPHVVGKSVGVPSVWVLFSITIGGSLLGLVGMIISIPVFSIIYVLLKEKVHHNLRKKNISVASLE